MSTPDPFQPEQSASNSFTAGSFAASPEKKKKSGCMKWGGIIAGAFILIGAINSIGGDPDADESLTAATSTATSPRSVEENDVAVTAVPSSEPDDSSPTQTVPEKVAPEATAGVGSDSSAGEDVPAEHRSALRKADSYANNMDMSKLRLYDQLTSEYGEEFSAAAAQYAIDNVQADWNANALAKARSYQENQNMSPTAIHDQLTSEYGEQFTAAEADYALANLNGAESTGTAVGGANNGIPAEYTSALATAESYAANQHMSRQGVYGQLTSEYGEQFTAAAAQYAIDNVQADWNANALAKARSYQENQNMSPTAIHDQLTSEYGEQFTVAEADYALANL